MELAQLVINAVRHLIGKLTIKSQRCGSPSENRNGGARVAKDEANVRESRERSGEQRAEDAAVGILGKLEQCGLNPGERRCAAHRR